MGTVKNTIDLVISGIDECFVSARDAKHAESLRVMAFNYKRLLPEVLQEEVGIQKVLEDDAWFLRIYRRNKDEVAIWVRGEDGKLAPTTMPKTKSVDRIVFLMREDGKTEEEIEELLREMGEKQEENSPLP